MKLIQMKDADQYLLRLPNGLRDRIRDLAETNGRSMNTEIVVALERHLMRANLFEELVARVEAIEKVLTK